MSDVFTERDAAKIRERFDHLLGIDFPERIELDDQFRTLFHQILRGPHARPGIVP